MFAEAGGEEPAKNAEDGFEEMLEALDLEPESPQETKPPASDDSPKADPNDPFGFLKK